MPGLVNDDVFASQPVAFALALLSLVRKRTPPAAVSGFHCDRRRKLPVINSVASSVRGVSSSPCPGEQDGQDCGRA